MKRGLRAGLALLIAAACGGEAVDGDPDPNGGGSGKSGGSGNGGGSGDVRTLEEACRILGDCDFRTLEEPTEQLWRVEVRRDAEGSYSLGGLRTVRVRETSGIPLPPADGPVFVVGLDGQGQPVDGQPIFFPDVDVIETRPERSVIEVPLDGVAQTQIGYVRALPDVVRIALLDGAAEAELDTLNLSGADPDELAIETTTSGLLVPASVCGNVTLLEEVEIEGVGKAELVGAFQLVEVAKAFDKLSPTVCLGVSRIAFVDLGTSSTLGRVVSRRGDLVMINSAYDYPGTPDF